MTRKHFDQSAIGLRKSLFYILTVVLIASIVNLTPSYWLEEITANASSLTLSQLGLASTWFSNGTSAYVQVGNSAKSLTIEIIRECTGIHVMAIFSGLVLPLRKGKAERKLVAIMMASAILFLLNITRVCLTIGLLFFDVFPFSIIFKNPTVETYHYPLSYLYGVFGVFLLIVSVDRIVLPELGDTLIEVLATLKNALHVYARSIKLKHR